MTGTYPAAQWLRFCLAKLGVSLIPGRGLRSHLPHGHKKQNVNSRSNIVTNSVKTLNMIHIKKKKKVEKKKFLSGFQCVSLTL